MPKKPSSANTWPPRSKRPKRLVAFGLALDDISLDAAPMAQFAQGGLAQTGQAILSALDQAGLIRRSGRGVWTLEGRR